MTRWFRFVGVLCTAALLVTTITPAARADDWWKREVQQTDWSINVNGSWCKLTGVVRRNGTNYVPMWQFSKCVPGLYYHSDANNFMIASYTINAGLPGQQELELRVDMTNPNTVYLVRYDSAHANYGGVYPDGLPREVGSDGESYDFSYHEEQPFVLNDTNYFSIRQLANTFDWQLTYDSSEGVIYVNTNQSYNPTDEERDALTPYSWSTLTDHYWQRGTPSTVRGMRAYTSQAPLLKRKLDKQGMPYIEDPRNFRIRVLTPTKTRHVAYDVYFTGDRPYAVLWLRGMASYDQWSADVKSMSGGISGTIGIATATTSAAVKIMRWAGVGATEAVEVGTGVGVVIAAVIGLDYAVTAQALERCDKQIERETGGSDSGDVTVGLVLRQATGHDILGCRTGYTDAPVNTNGISN